ncbi:MAG: hypothetical protein HYY17_05115 [Planctomycetes bacterium]|nr:hypothetical protein [Planctomycetota bacterium]
MRLSFAPLFPLCLCVSVASSPSSPCLRASVAQDKQAEEEFLKKVKRINLAIDWLLDADAELREAGRKVLREIGPDAIPFLEQRLADKGVGELYALLRELRSREGASENRWAEDKDLPTPEEMEKEAPKVAHDTIEKYVFSRYHDAWLLARKGNHEKAVEMVNALLTLEPRSKYADGLRTLRRYCDIRITQATICEAKAIPAKKAVVAGEKVEIVLRVRNVAKGPITISFGEEDAGFAVLDTSIRIPTPTGDVHEASRTDRERFEKEISIAAGAQWEHACLVDTGTGMETSADLRIFTVQPWAQPRKIDLPMGALCRRIVFEPATIKVVPRKYEKDIENPLAALGRYMDSGTINDVFVAALLLDGEDKEKGMDLLIRAMREAKNPEGRAFLGRLLGFMTGRKFGADPRAWTQWWESRKSGEKK